MCGNYNNDSTDDFIRPDGQQVSNANEFVASWVVGDTSSCGTLPPPTVPCFGPARTTATNRCAALQSSVFAPCHTTVDPQPFIDDCIDDYCTFCDETNRDDCLCRSLAAYASVCTAAGVPLPNWRDFFCRKYCTWKMFWGGNDTKHTIHWKTFMVHQAEAIMYSTQQVIQGGKLAEKP